ncbi:MAG TPA: ATP-binding protein, partial [Opitutaceae bacterium]
GQQVINTSEPFGTPLPKVRFIDESRAAAMQGRTYFSKLVLGPVRKQYVAYVSIPIFRRGELKYTLDYAMFPTHLSPWMSSGEAPPDWIISLIDRDGRIAARNHLPEKFVGQKAREQILEVLASKEDEAILGGKTLEGIDVLTVFSRCPISGWSIAVGVPKIELYASAQHLLLLAIIVSGVSFVILATMALWVARGVNRAVGSLVTDAKALGAGTPLSSVRTDLEEIGVVSTALRKAADQLRARETDLKHLNENLDARVQERTRELAHANRELENFARIASHDLKEPLRLMTAYAGILRAEYNEKLDETGRMYLERIEAAAERQRALINDILAYSRVLNLPVPIEKVDLDAVLKSVQDDLEMRLRETNGTIEAKALGIMWGDAVQIRQLLLNLISNSLKFRREDVAPMVRVSSVEKEGCLHLIVDDNGIGFESEYSEKIFAPFERLHAGKKYDGTGMGLAIVRMIAERHGGTVFARSEVGKGSRFEVVLPMRTPADAKSSS